MVFEAALIFYRSDRTRLHLMTKTTKNVEIHIFTC